ncbi:MAG: bifunctional adenosylcobinamide kinase/adenosylcobinamide-phosphate guanylyltransferase [Deltaproteobacteria bacterium]|nr:bifunctional adenosylcobinamide kinase/adenosylcobinamide-phosphate guanylyltransferase [Deltaproteobacteria bacterium]
MIHLVTGGARAGKSGFVLAQAEAVPGPIHFVATAEARDADMAARIARHQAERGARYHTVEAPMRLPLALGELGAGGAVVVDCLTMWVANHVLAGASEAELATQVDALCEALRAQSRPTWVVTNEVGLGIVPDNALARRFRDELGRCNQRVAAISTRVSLLVAGIPVSVR